MELFLDILGYGFIAVVLLVIAYLFVKIFIGGLEALTKDND
jgi:hypothetical protein